LKKIILIIIGLFSFSGISIAQYSLDVAFPNLTFMKPVELVNSGDGTNRLFVVTQNGIIYVFPNSPSANAKIFLDLSDSVTQNGSETGLLGLAFHPNYSNNGYFYVDYTTMQSPLRSKISRFSVSAANPDSALRSSEQVLITQLQPYANHNGGHLLFGPDHYLYISFGDGGSGGDPQNNAQNRSVLLGKILRINVDSASGGNNYSIPPTNPFYNNNMGYRQEIFTYGMRNTWKFSFDIPTGRLWAADVGQDEWEEIDLLQSGRNYGWRIMEGFNCYNPPSGCDTTGLTLPIWSYSHSVGNSITGGYVYHGALVPGLTGKYIYGDYVVGKIWALTYDGINPPQNELLLDSPYLISTFGIDENNELYICSYGSTGRIYKFHPVPIGVSGNTEETPSGFVLQQNYPNPFNPETKIKYTVPRESFITFKIYNTLGKEINTLVSGTKTAGNYEVTWNASNYPSGVYFYRLTSGSESVEKKMAVVK
jgi:glucose/arabinose dehydrogenase